MLVRTALSYHRNAKLLHLRTFMVQREEEQEVTKQGTRSNLCSNDLSVPLSGPMERNQRSSDRQNVHIPVGWMTCGYMETPSGMHEIVF